MTFQYLWLKVLEVLTQAKRRMTSEELRREMGRRGFALDERAMASVISKLHEQGLVELMVLAGAQTDAVGSVGITPLGERKFRSIIRL